MYWIFFSNYERTCPINAVVKLGLNQAERYNHGEKELEHLTEFQIKATPCLTTEIGYGA